MGIFNYAIKTGHSVSKFNFGLNSADFATNEELLTIEQDMQLYLHKSKERNNSMNKQLDMAGNVIINLGNPENPTDAVTKRYVYKKIQNLIEEYNERIDEYKKAFQNSTTLINNHYNELANVITALKENEIANLDLKLNGIENDFTLTKENIKENQKKIKEQHDVYVTIVKRIDGLDTLTRQVLPTEISNIGKLVSNLIDDNKLLKRKVSKLDNKVHEVFLLEIHNTLRQEIKVISSGIPKEYEIKATDSPNRVKTRYLFSLFDLITSVITDYTNFIKLNHVNLINITGFQIKKSGTYIIDIKLIITITSGDIDTFCLSWVNPRSTLRIEFIEKDKDIFKAKFTLQLGSNTPLLIYPHILIDNTQFTIEEGSYIKFAYSLKP